MDLMLIISNALFLAGPLAIVSPNLSYPRDIEAAILAIALYTVVIILSVIQLLSN